MPPPPPPPPPRAAAAAAAADEPPRPAKKRRAAAPVPSFERGNAARTFARRAPAALPVVAGDGRVARSFAPARLPAKRRRGREGEGEGEGEGGGEENAGDGEDGGGEDGGGGAVVASPGKRRAKRNRRAAEGGEDFYDELERFEAAKARIAALASQVVSNPEANVGRLTDLRKMAKSANRNVTALVVLTESQLYKDVCPSYRIREIGEEEASVKVSKDVAALRNFEQGLLRCYSRFVKSAVSLSRWSSGKVARRGRAADWSDAERRMHKVRRAACSALCEVARSLLHFNMADEVGRVVAGLTCDRDPAVRREAGEALAEVLGEAHKCAGSSLAARVVVAEYLSKAVVGGKGVAQVETIAPLLEVRFLFFSKFNKGAAGRKDDKPGKFNRKHRVKMSEKQAEKAAKEAAERERAERLDLERDMREAHAEATPQELFAAKKSLLNATCKACFNVIKAASEAALEAAACRGDASEASASRARSRKPPPALSAALDGVHLVASMLHAELLDAILAALNPILEGDTLPLATRFRCLAAAYAILSAHAATQAVDADSFTRDARAMDACLYASLAQLFGPAAPLSGDEGACAEALRALAAASSGRRMPPVRAAAIARRLQIVAAASAPTHGCVIGLLSAAQAMLPPQLVECLYPAGGGGEGEDAAAVGGGFGEDAGLLQLYDVTTDDPDVAGAEHSAAWELAALSAHFHPDVQKISKLCCAGVCGERRPAGHAVSAGAMDRYSSEGGGFNPPPAAAYGGPKKSTKTAGRRHASLAAFLGSLDGCYAGGGEVDFPDAAVADMWRRAS